MSQTVRVGEYILPLLFSPQSTAIPIGLEYRFHVIVNLYLALAEGAVHSIIVGPTGRGKTTLLTWLTLVASLQGHRVVVVDPKGDLLSYIKLYTKNLPSVLDTRIVKLKDAREAEKIVLEASPDNIKSTTLKSIVIVDESWQAGLDTVDKITRIGRSLGISVIASSQYPEDFHPRMWANSTTAIIFGSPSREYAENITRFTPLRAEDTTILSNLSTGETLVLYKWSHRPLVVRLFNPATVFQKNPALQMR